MPATGPDATCVTGIDGLDSILGGGVPAGSMVLVTGVPGAGKTSLSLEFAIRGAARGERSLVVTTVERPEKLLLSVPDFDFYDPAMMEDGRLEILEVAELTGSKALNATTAAMNGHAVFRPQSAQSKLSGGANVPISLVDAISKRLVRDDIKRLVIDSFSTLFYGNEDKSLQRDILLFLSDLMYDKRCTCFLISDADPRTSIESLMADGVIVLGNQERKTDLLRTMQVLKMKSCSHSRTKHVIDLTDAGVLVTPMLRSGT